MRDGDPFDYVFVGNQKVATLDGASTVYHHPDHLMGGSVDTDDTGAIVQLLDYYPYGSVRIDEHTSGGYQNPYQFTGKELDSGTDLHYYGARYYSSELGRFFSVDPWQGDMTNPQSFNKYSYVMNNPVKYVDPTGEYPVLSETTDLTDSSPLLKQAASYDHLSHRQALVKMTKSDSVAPLPAPQ